MQVSNRGQKEALEKAAIDWLLKCPLFEDFVLVGMQDKPDAIISSTDGKEAYGVEICRPFYDAREAQLLLGRANGMSGLQSGQGVMQRINEEIQKKINKFGNYPQSTRLYYY